MKYIKVYRIHWMDPLAVYPNCYAFTPILPMFIHLHPLHLFSSIFTCFTRCHIYPFLPMFTCFQPISHIFTCSHPLLPIVTHCHPFSLFINYSHPFWPILTHVYQFFFCSFHLLNISQNITDGGLMTLKSLIFSTGGCRRKLLLDCAKDFLSKIWHHITTISFVS